MEVSILQESLEGSLLCGENGFRRDIHRLELMSIVPLKQKAPQTTMEPSPLCSVENSFIHLQPSYDTQLQTASRVTM